MSVVRLENGSENVCADCEMRLLKLKRMRQCVVSLKNPSELKCIVLVNKYVKSVSLASLKNRGQCIGLVNKYVKICCESQESWSVTEYCIDCNTC